LPTNNYGSFFSSLLALCSKWSVRACHPPTGKGSMTWYSKGAMCCLLAFARRLTSACRNSQQRQRANCLLPGAVVDIMNARRRAKRPGKTASQASSKFPRALAPLRMEATSSWSKWAEPRQHRLLRPHLSPPRAKRVPVGSRLAKGLVLPLQVHTSGSNLQSLALRTETRHRVGGKSQGKRRTCHGWDPWLPAASAVWSVGAITQTGYCALRRRVPQDGAGFSRVGAS
jgi:hypothetical protein